MLLHRVQLLQLYDEILPLLSSPPPLLHQAGRAHGSDTAAEEAGAGTRGEARHFKNDENRSCMPENLLT